MKAGDFDEVSRSMLLRGRIKSAIERLSGDWCSVDAIVFGRLVATSNRLSSEPGTIDIDGLDIDPSDRGAKFLADVEALLAAYLTDELHAIEADLKAKGVELE